MDDEYCGQEFSRAPVKVRTSIQFFASLSPYINAFLNFLYPPFCVLCKVRLFSAERMICEDCWQSLPRLSSHEHPRHAGPVEIDAPFDHILAVWQYSEQIQQLIHEFKYLKTKTLARPIGTAMATCAFEHAEYLSADLIVPVPLHKTRLRERGFNQSSLLAEIVAQKLAIPVARNVLSRIRYTRHQAQLNAAEREENVQGAFQLRNEEVLKDRIVILVDDVFTTGATLRLCAQCLKNGDPKKILTLTAARTL